MIKLLRFSDLKANGIVRNRATLSRWIRNIGFPPGVMIGMNTRVWTEAEIEAWLAERARASAEIEAPNDPRKRLRMSGEDDIHEAVPKLPKVRHLNEEREGMP